MSHLVSFSSATDSPSTSSKGRPSLKGAVYKNPEAPVDARVADLLSRMTLEEKASQIVQGDVRNWIDEKTNVFNVTGLAWSTKARGGSFYVSITVPQTWTSDATKKAQEYIQNNTYLGIPAFVQSESIHGFLANEWHYEYFTMADAGASDRLCDSFKMYKSKPVDWGGHRQLHPAGGRRRQDGRWLVLV
ncbi:hypothetical protein B0H67DRAFT_649766 [Lasiosphaeris hirsuta]|uniref:Glycoside hydrolase family 3 N-terminal domain-containing protein n=1 Tax=Lasiosphaeris hirsuta TaxID=260670 RepID=A0AA39ZXF7_9PEZI|nr:hypothetical protein B0H67DRAFT_649766 [Lasiosphaeris hirsuta]